MKKFSLTFAVLGAFGAWAYAGPEPMASKEIAPVPAPPPSCFAGWYFGIHGGGILTEFDSQTSAFEHTFADNDTNGEFDFDTTGKRHGDTTWEGGLHAGYNWQFNRLVLGIEADIQGSNYERNQSASDHIQFQVDEEEEGQVIYNTQVTSKTELDWYATGRLRAGYTLGDRVMPYITGGGAVGLAGVSEATAVHGEKPFPAKGTRSFTDLVSSSDNKIHGGWTAGGGIDFCLTEHWILNFTYLYIDLGDANASTSFVTTLPGGGGGGTTVRTFDSETRVTSDLKFHVFQGGLTFHF